MEMALSVVRPEMAMDFSSKEVGSILDEGGGGGGGGGGCPWTAHVLLWDC